MILLHTDDFSPSHIGVVMTNFRDVLRSLLAWISGQGDWGMVVFGLTYILATIAFLPGLILALGAGLLFGVAGGTAVVSVASTLGAGAGSSCGGEIVE